MKCVVVGDAIVLLGGKLVTRVVDGGAAHGNGEDDRFLPVPAVDGDHDGREEEQIGQSQQQKLQQLNLNGHRITCIRACYALVT